jgi:hypothetical protein
MKVLGQFGYLFCNNVVILLFDDHFYFVTLNKKTSIKYSISRELPIFLDPLDKLTPQNFQEFLNKHRYVKVNYNADCTVKLKHSWGENKVIITIAGKEHKLYIWQRPKTKLYQQWLQEAFDDKFTVEGDKWYKV